MMILLYFQFTQTLVFTICPMLNIRDSSIRCLEKNSDVHQQIQTLIVKKKSWSSGLETGQQKNKCHSRWWTTQLDIKLKQRTDNISLKMMSVLSSELWCHFLTKSRNFDTGHGGGAILNTDICSRAKNWTKQKANVRKK